MPFESPMTISFSLTAREWFRLRISGRRTAKVDILESLVTGGFTIVLIDQLQHHPWDWLIITEVAFPTLLLMSWIVPFLAPRRTRSFVFTLDNDRISETLDERVRSYAWDEISSAVLRTETIVLRVRANGYKMYIPKLALADPDAFWAAVRARLASAPTGILNLRTENVIINTAER
jgi:hypothetical protein